MAPVNSSITAQQRSSSVPQSQLNSESPEDDANKNKVQTFSSAYHKKSRRKQKQPKRLTLALSEDEYDMMLAEEEEGGTFKFHPESKWQEPYVPGAGLLPNDPPQHGLTLYEVHRKPRVAAFIQQLFHPIVPEGEDSQDKSSSPESSRRKSSRGDATVNSDRITCDFQNLIDEFRCVICFGTLRRTKIVRECLHRFCDSCVQTCLRRMSNSCPVCRIVIPSRRSLTVDHVYDTLIDALGLADSDEDDGADPHRVDEVIAIAASLHEANHPPPTNLSKCSDNNQVTSPSSLQVAIAKKQEMRLQQQQQQSREIDGSKTTSATAEKSTSELSPVGDTQQQTEQQEKVAPLVKLHLQPHPSAIDRLPSLDLPYIRIAGDATVGVLEDFVRAKIGLTPTSSISPDAIYFSAKLWRRPLRRSLQLKLLGERSNGKLVMLFYRSKKNF